MAPDGSTHAAWTPSRSHGLPQGMPSTPAHGVPSNSHNNGGTGPLSASGAFNLAAGAAAVAALNVAAAAGGNNTGPVGVGMRRFGFKSKALRVGGASGAPSENSEVLMQAASVELPKDEIQPVSREPSTAPPLPADADPLQPPPALNTPAHAAGHSSCAAAQAVAVSTAAHHHGVATIMESDCEAMDMDTEVGEDALAASRKRRAEPSPHVPAQPQQPVSCTPVSMPHSTTAGSLQPGQPTSAARVMVVDGMSKRRMSPPPINTHSASLGGTSAGTLPGQSYAHQPNSTPHQQRPTHAHVGLASTPAPAAQQSTGAAPPSSAQQATPQPHTSRSCEQQQPHHQPASENANPGAATHSHITDENQAPHPRSSAPLHPSRGLSSSTPAAKSSSSETPKLQERQPPSSAVPGLGASQPPHTHPASLPIPSTPSQASAVVLDQGRGRANADGSATPGLREPLRWVVSDHWSRQLLCTVIIMTTLARLHKLSWNVSSGGSQHHET